MKKILYAIPALFAGASAFADSSGDVPTIDVASVNSMMVAIRPQLEDFVTGALPILAGIACAFLAFWLGKVAFRLVKSWASMGK